MADGDLGWARRAVRSRFAQAATVVGLWVPVFLIGMVVHESLHAVAVLALGSHPDLVMRPWPLALAPLSITGIHVAPVPSLDATGQFLDNLMGPGIAATLFAVMAWRLAVGSLRLAVIATALGLAFYAVIEPLDVVLDGRLELSFLTTPEFNYGVPLLLALIVAGASAGTKRPLIPAALSAAPTST